MYSSLFCFVVQTKAVSSVISNVNVNPSVETHKEKCQKRERERSGKKKTDERAGRLASINARESAAPVYQRDIVACMYVCMRETHQEAQPEFIFASETLMVVRSIPEWDDFASFFCVCVPPRRKNRRVF
jgi:hypothetical protein